MDNSTDLIMAVVEDQLETCLEITEEADCYGACAWGAIEGVDIPLECSINAVAGAAAMAEGNLDQAGYDSIHAACATASSESACTTGTITLGEEMDMERSQACEVTSGPDACMISRAKAQSLLTADGADPYVKAEAYVVSSTGTTCRKGTNETTCEALGGCVWEETKCQTNDLTSYLMLNNKCSGSLSASLVALFKVMEGETATIEEMYDMAGVPDESSSAKLAEQADEKIEAAETLTAAAEDKKEALFTASASLTEDEKAKATVLAAAAIAGVEVKKLSATFEAADADTACVNAFASMELTADQGYCSATAAARRRLHASSFNTEVLLNPDEVDTAAAVAAIKKNDPTVTVTETEVNPIEEMETIDNLDSDSLATFKTSAAAAGEANVEAAAYEAEVEATPTSAASSVAAVSAIATAALAAAACVFA
jgi:hypothetical protein